MDGLKFKTKHGFIGLAVEQKEFMVEGINEKGLSAGLFYFPNYGKYPSFEESKKDISLADFQVVSYVLAECSTVDEVKEALSKVRIINIDPRSSTVSGTSIFSTKSLATSGGEVLNFLVSAKAIVLAKSPNSGFGGNSNLKFLSISSSY